MGEEETAQGEGGNQSAQTAISESEAGTMADTTSGKSGQPQTRNGRQGSERGSEASCQPSSQPKLGGTVDVGNPRSGLDSTANRVDRLRLLGNGVVPHTAAKAFSTLTGRLADVVRKTD